MANYLHFIKTLLKLLGQETVRAPDPEGIVWGKRANQMLSTFEQTVYDWSWMTRQGHQNAE